MTIRFTLLSFIMVLSAPATEVYSLGWLRGGCVGFSKYSEKEDLTEKESKETIQVGVWIQGYLQAVEMIGYSNEGIIKKVPKDWSSSLEVSESVLAYLREFEQKFKLRIPDDFDAKSFFSLWFDVKHPDTEPIRAYASEQIFLTVYFPEAYAAQKKTEE